MNDHRRLTYNIPFFIGVGVTLAFGICSIVIPQRTAVFILKLIFNFLISGTSSLCLYVFLGTIGVSKIGESWRLNNLFTLKRFGQFMTIFVLLFTAVLSLALNDWLNQGGLGEWIIIKGMLFEIVGTYQYVGWSFVGIGIALFVGFIYYNREQIAEWFQS